MFQDVEGLAQQRSKLSCEVQQMQVKKTDLDAQITNLEYRKLGLEQSGRLVTRREIEGLAEQSGSLVTRWENEGLAEQSGTGRLVTRRENEGLAEQSGRLMTRWENESLAEQSGSLVTRLRNEGLEQSTRLVTRRENESSEIKVEENVTEEYSVKVNITPL